MFACPNIACVLCLRYIHKYRCIPVHKATEDLSGSCCGVGARRRFVEIYKRIGNRVDCGILPIISVFRNFKNMLQTNTVRIKKFFGLFFPWAQQHTTSHGNAVLFSAGFSDTSRKHPHGEQQSSSEFHYFIAIVL